MKRNRSLYYYESKYKIWVRCRICQHFACPTLLFEDMRDHIKLQHPIDCHRCWNNHNGMECRELFINHREMREHKRLMRTKQ